LPIAPGDPHLERMGARIRGQLAARRRTVAEQEAQLTALLQSAQTSLATGNPAQAAELARQVLALVPDEPRATALVAQAQAATDAARRRSQQLAARTPAPAPPTGAASAAAS